MRSPVVAPGQPFPPLGESLRNIVATSAISHGVDVDKFNAMFFAGLPSDIAEYIQASSRVGRTHVGFSLLVPTPHSRRDRYVIETHDQFHRFLERMIPPPAVQRWAERAIRRAMPSILQAFLCGVVEQELFALPPLTRAQLGPSPPLRPSRHGPTVTREEIRVQFAPRRNLPWKP